MPLMNLPLQQQTCFTTNGLDDADRDAQLLGAGLVLTPSQFKCFEHSKADKLGEPKALLVCF